MQMAHYKITIIIIITMTDGNEDGYCGYCDLDVDDDDDDDNYYSQQWWS